MRHVFVLAAATAAIPLSVLPVGATVLSVSAFHLSLVSHPDSAGRCGPESRSGKTRR